MAATWVLGVVVVVAAALVCFSLCVCVQFVLRSRVGAQNRTCCVSICVCLCVCVYMFGVYMCIVYGV
eukprot:m.270126 g.270126  ORF g.270126 m.270126 type:complete len:67 (-) comp45645_c0_seq1:33-233(-)